MRKGLKYFVLSFLFFSIGMIYFFDLIGCSVENKDCSSCHAEIFTEWKESAHANAWKNKRFQALFTSMGNPEKCVSCHAPDAILFNGLTLIPKPRKENRENGIDCASCHGGPGGFQGPFEVQHIPHPARQDSVFFGIQLCISCHGQNGEIHSGMDMKQFNQVDSFLKTDLIVQGKDCNSCHSPAVKRYATNKKDYPVRTTRTHRWLGWNDKAILSNLIHLDFKKLPDKIYIWLNSQNVGHAFPGSGMKELVVQTLVKKQDGTDFLKGEEVFSYERKNRLLPGQVQFIMYRLALAQGSCTVKVRLKRSEEESVLLADQEFYFGISSQVNSK